MPYNLFCYRWEILFGNLLDLPAIGCVISIDGFLFLCSLSGLLMMELVVYGMLEIPQLMLVFMHQELISKKLASICVVLYKMLATMNHQYLWVEACWTETNISNHAQANDQTKAQILCCAFNPSGTVFVTGSADKLARVRPPYLSWLRSVIKISLSSYWQIFTGLGCLQMVRWNAWGT